VTLVTGKATAPVPPGIRTVHVQSAQQMLEAVMERFPETDLVIKAAAVADYRPAVTAEHKIKKKDDEMTITLVKNTDILQTLGQRKTTQFLVGFAAETENIDDNAIGKLKRKQCDLLVANDVSQEGAGFGTDTNIVRIYDGNGLVESLPIMSKFEVARRLLLLAAERMKRGAGAN